MFMFLRQNTAFAPLTVFQIADASLAAKASVGDLEHCELWALSARSTSVIFLD